MFEMPEKRLGSPVSSFQAKQINKSKMMIFGAGEWCEKFTTLDNDRMTKSNQHDRIYKDGGECIFFLQ